MITCPKCNRVKLAKTEFGRKGNGRRQAYCKACQRHYAKEHYQRNKQKYISKAQNRNALVRERNNQVADNLKNKPCADCGIQYPPWVMDFDHTPGSIKLNCVSRMKNYPTQSMLQEIDKCDVVCANCHRQRTHQRALKLFR